MKQVTLTSAILWMLLHVFLTASYGAKPMPPALPPVRFQVQLVAYPSSFFVNGNAPVRDVNDLGELVGNFSVSQNVTHAFVYSPLLDPDRAVDAHELVANPIADQVGPDWYLAGLGSINNLGDAVGYLGQNGFPIYERRRGCVIVGANTLSPQLVLLPDRPTSDSEPWSLSKGVEINDDGVVAGTFVTETSSNGAFVIAPLDEDPTILPVTLLYDTVELNHATQTRGEQVAGQLNTGEMFRYTLGGGLEVFPQFSYYAREQYTISGLNDDGAFCGRRIVKNRYEAFLNDGTFTAFRAMNGAGAINEAGDMSIWGQPQLVHQGSGLMNLDDLVVGAEADLAQWRGANFRFLVDLTQRGAWNYDSAVIQYPGLVGFLSGGTATSAIFLLTPVRP